MDLVLGLIPTREFLLDGGRDWKGLVLSDLSKMFSGSLDDGLASSASLFWLICFGRVANMNEIEWVIEVVKVLCLLQEKSK